jgi:ABC-type multidrug transport system permease subunit
MLQGIILIVVAFVLYRIAISVNQLAQLFLVVLVYSTAFIGILSIPMLFLSGVFFPFETMPGIMASLGNALPITMGIKALGSVLIYQKTISSKSGYLSLNRR